MKWEILRTLREREDYVSGQQLCQGLGVSRTAVWKAIEELRTEGYVIDAVRNKGYCLVKAADAITPAELKTELQTVRQPEREGEEDNGNPLPEQGHGSAWCCALR